MSDGWIKLHRKALDSEVFLHAGLWKLWTLCLFHAAHKETWVKAERSIRGIHLKPGQFITGRYALYQDYHYDPKRKGPARKGKQPSPSTLMRWLETLEKMQNLNIEKTTQYSIVTIINWDRYQGDEQRVNNERTTSEQRVNTNKNVKNKKNIYSPNFLSWYENYPRKESKADAARAYEKALKKVGDPSILNEGLKRSRIYWNQIRKEREYIPLPATWLNREQWLDEYPKPPKSVLVEDDG